MEVIAHIHTEFPEKFGIPRQSGLARHLSARIVFVPKYRNADALRGLEDFSHIWLIWEFSQARRDGWSPTVRPPRLGGNTRMGVFATRSPFRPNPIGLSSVRLERVDTDTPEGPVLHVSGADLMDGTPIFDIKPYLPYTDSHPDACAGFADTRTDYTLEVNCPGELLAPLSPRSRTALKEILAQDPRPSYQRDPDRIYGLSFDGWTVRFSVTDRVLTVHTVTK